METKNIMIVGVGGQGSLLASKLLGHLLMSQGYDVKVSEVHGMSQRGGSVVTYVRYGDKVFSPVIDKGQADYIVSFELLEAARWLPFLKKDFEEVTYPWELLPKIKTIVAREIEKGLEGYTEIEPGVFVGENVKIAKTATIEAPAIIGSGTELRPGAYLRGNVIIGENCVAEATFTAQVIATKK